MIGTAPPILIRPYQPDDLESIYALVTAAAQADHTRRITHEALRTTTDPDHTTVVATLADGTIGGFAWWDAAERPDIPLDGWVQLDLRRRGIGTALLRAAESITSTLGAERLTVRTYSDLPGAMALFPAGGFVEIRRFHQMWMRLDDSWLDVPPLPDGFVVRPFHSEDAHEICEVYEADLDAFSTHWNPQPQPFESWKRRRLTDPEPELWVLIWDVAAGRVAALCMTYQSQFGYAPGDGWISHLGVRPAYRGRGLGRIALIEGLRRLRRAGFNRAGLHVDSGNPVAIQLYSSVGLRVTREDVHFAKPLRGAP